MDSIERFVNASGVYPSGSFRARGGYGSIVGIYARFAQKRAFRRQRLTKRAESAVGANGFQHLLDFPCQIAGIVLAAYCGYPNSNHGGIFGDGLIGRLCQDVGVACRIIHNPASRRIKAQVQLGGIVGLVGKGDGRQPAWG